MKSKMLKNGIGYISILLLFVAFFSCHSGKNGTGSSKNESDSLKADFPKVVNIDSLKKTKFAPTLENDVSGEKNVIYAPTLLYAWDEIRKFNKGPIKLIGDVSNMLKLVNTSNTFKDALQKGEYKTDVKIDDSTIIAKAIFSKSLPFAVKFNKLDSPIIFKGQKVKTFGTGGSDKEIAAQVDILYYKDDRHFIVKLQPGDTANQIIMAMGIKLNKRFIDIINESNRCVKQGQADRINEKTSWKYRFTEDDNISIPNIRFNVECNYKDMEGQYILLKKNIPYIIIKAYQRTAFVLNYEGAKVESIAEQEDKMAGLDSMEVANRPHPKHLIFDQPYIIILKKTTSKNPYFVMKVENAELMEKW